MNRENRIGHILKCLLKMSAKCITEKAFNSRNLKKPINHDLPNLHLPSRQDYRFEPPHLASNSPFIM